MNINQTCPHTLCEHLGDGKMQCKHCGSIEPMIVSTIRVREEDYRQLQALYTQVRCLMQAESVEVFDASLSVLGSKVGIEPRLKANTGKRRRQELAIIEAAMEWMAGDDDAVDADEKLLKVLSETTREGL